MGVFFKTINPHGWSGALAILSRDYLGSIVSKSGRVRGNNIWIKQGKAKSQMCTQGSIVYVTEKELRHNKKKVAEYILEVIGDNWR